MTPLHMALDKVFIETVTEDLDTKLALYKTLEPDLKPGALLVTNTSSLSVRELAAVLARPGSDFRRVAKRRDRTLIRLLGSSPFGGSTT